MNRNDFKNLTPMEQIRALTGIIPNELNSAIIRLALINLITRVEAGDADKEFLNETIDKSFKE